MMCETCNPLCGGCKAPRAKAIICPSCNKGSIILREEALFRLGRAHRLTEFEEFQVQQWSKTPFFSCLNCGADLTDALERAVEPLKCIRSGIMCGWPCGLRMRARGSQEGPCADMAPLSKLDARWQARM